MDKWDTDGDGVHFVSYAHLMPQPVNKCVMIWLLLQGLSFEILCGFKD